MLEAEIKFRLKWIELDNYVVYTKNYQKSEMLREQKREPYFCPKELVTYPRSAGGGGGS